jgi:hypothetical protein
MVVNVEEELSALLWKLRSGVESEGRSTKAGGSREDVHVIRAISPFSCLQDTRSKIEFCLNYAG